MVLLNGGLSEPVTRYNRFNGMTWGKLEKIGGVILQPLETERTEPSPFQKVRTPFLKLVVNPPDSFLQI